MDPHQVPNHSPLRLRLLHVLLPSPMAKTQLAQVSGLEGALDKEGHRRHLQPSLLSLQSAMLYQKSETGNAHVFVQVLFIGPKLFSFLVLRSHPAIFRGFSWLCRRVIPGGAQRILWMPAIKPRLVACKANALPSVLSLWSCGSKS